MTITAMLSTAGAVNATVYPVPGPSRVAGRAGRLPAVLRQEDGAVPDRACCSPALLIIVLVWAFDLSAIASLGSAVALLIFLMISIGHFRIRKETGASAACS